MPRLDPHSRFARSVPSWPTTGPRCQRVWHSVSVVWHQHLGFQALPVQLDHCRCVTTTPLYLYCTTRLTDFPRATRIDHSPGTFCGQTDGVVTWSAASRSGVSCILVGVADYGPSSYNTGRPMLAPSYGEAMPSTSFGPEAIFPTVKQGSVLRPDGSSITVTVGIELDRRVLARPDSLTRATLRASFASTTTR